MHPHIFMFIKNLHDEHIYQHHRAKEQCWERFGLKVNDPNLTET